MIFDIPTILEYCSSFTRLECGDVIATGTPGGVGVKRTPPLWMKPGELWKWRSRAWAPCGTVSHKSPEEWLIP